jgi:Chaperone of endosialidase
LLLVALVLASVAIPSIVQAVNPPPDGGYPTQNTAEGKDALFSLTTGARNTAVGFRALHSNMTSDENTSIGSQALSHNTSGTDNTATGAKALLSNISGSQNTATGDQALFSNNTGNFNTADGAFALFNNVDGFGNSAFGDSALFENIHGAANTAIGNLALSNNDDGVANVAVGDSALTHNAHGSFNTVVGYEAGFTAKGDDNIYIGASAADRVTIESGTIRIGDPNFVSTCYIAGISGQTASGGIAVFIDANGKLGTTTSSRRFKDDIKPMEQASEALFSLKPVTFHYKKEIDATGTSQFGLVAEDVEKVNPDLVVRDQEGKPYTVRYDQVNAMLLNEFLKEHQTVQQQGATIAHCGETN